MGWCLFFYINYIGTVFVDTLATDVKHHKKTLLLKRLIRTIFILGSPCIQSAPIIIIIIVVVVVVDHYHYHYHCHHHHHYYGR